MSELPEKLRVIHSCNYGSTVTNEIGETIAEHLTIELAAEIVHRYNNYPALAAENKAYREAMETIIQLNEVERKRIEIATKALAQQAPVSACNKETEQIKKTLQQQGEIEDKDNG